MAASQPSVHGENHDEPDSPITRAEVQQIENNLLQAMEHLLNARLPAAGGGAVQPPFGDPKDDIVDAQSADDVADSELHGPPNGGGRGFVAAGARGGGAHGRGHGPVAHFGGRFELHGHPHEVEYGDNDVFFFRENDLEQRHARPCRGAVLGNGEHHRGHHDHDDSDNVARVKLSVLKFTGKEDADAYLD